MKLTKMHGLGNDFVLCQDLEGHITNLSELAVTLCDRHTGIGADGLIVVRASEKAQIQMIIYNADGSQAEMCGNGIRCFAHYVRQHQLVDSDEFTVETLAGIMKPKIVERGPQESLVRVDMGQPIFLAKDIPMNVQAEQVLDYEITIDGHPLKLSAVLMGVPHAMVIVDRVDEVPLTTWGPLIERHSLFPRGTNVNFVEVTGSNRMRVRTWERGAGATLACGTGCCSMAVLATEKGLMKGPIDLDVQLGTMHIDYQKEGDGHVYMTGPARAVFETEWTV